MLHPDVKVISEKYTTLEPVLDERARRLWAATEARAIGRGGVSRVSEATGLSRITIRAGLSELHSTLSAHEEVAERIRRPGGGRKPLTEHAPKLLRALEILVDPGSRGDPMSPLRWTCKSAAKLASELASKGHCASERSVNRLLHALGYSLQSNRKTIEGGDHPQGQRISISLNSQYFREELGIHHAPNHLAAEAIFDGMTLQQSDREAS